jgi:hypothetical protein
MGRGAEGRPILLNQSGYIGRKTSFIFCVMTHFFFPSSYYILLWKRVKNEKEKIDKG